MGETLRHASLCDQRHGFPSRGVATLPAGCGGVAGVGVAQLTEIRFMAFHLIS